jgi:uncharacterized membrane protein YoaK (UPF0700 family)
MLEVAKIAVALVLTFVAGYVDALGWLSLDRVFSAQMSGNAVLLAVHLAAGEGGHAWLQGDAVASFFLGLLVSGAVVEIGMRRRTPRVLTVVLGIELVLLILFALLVSQFGLAPGTDEPHPPAAIYVMVAIVAIALGAQNTSLRMAGILSAFTTHITGALTVFSEAVIVCGFALLQPAARRREGGGFATERLKSHHGQAVKNLAQSLSILLGFFSGALAGAMLSRVTGIAGAMPVPLALLIAVALFERRVPLIQSPSAVETE